ncbi:ABC transporter substrate-binding protein [Salinibacterium sp. SYSU T00001]|uniref:ABC transporter substrate-binding protein n=1 Tax=Homoserinimonas sedimenticola TaxID=2986805 RepID=UPI00223569C9|nr:ABC transporter substrate-binding protein [Salinibacterium sedimenticola]MCW4385235.1 ABC transporter substrate-binding protein [Salinibacterium sedimenticola]
MFTALRHRGLAAVAVAGAAGLVLAGCSGGDGGGGGDVDCSDYEQYGTFEDASVEVYATIIDVEADQLVESWMDFEDCTGITIDYVGTQEAETQINVRVAAGDAPDIMIVPQPGLLQRLIGDGAVVPASAEVEANVDEFWSESWKGYGSVDGEFYAAPLMASVKGYIWYSPADFEENGYEVPETWDELMDLTEEMAENTTATYRPWCVGFGSGDATGWPGTDWIEDLVLRMHGPEAYDQWVAGELEFSSPEIQEAFDAAGEILRNPDYVNGGFGGVESINSTTFQDAGLAILDGNCSLHHQASFYEAQWGEDVEVAEDGDVWAFLTPKVDPDAGDSVTGGGEFVAAFNDDPATDAVQQFLSSDTWANIRVGLGGVISANNGVDPSVAGSEIGAQSMEILQGEDTVFRFDGSDLMPAAVGTSSFWEGMVNWIGGDSTEAVTSRIDASFP